MFAWVRRIRISRITIGPIEFEIGDDAGQSNGPDVNLPPAPPPVETKEPGKPKPPSLTIEKRLIRPDSVDGLPAFITVRGEVVGTIGKDLGIRIRNEDEVREFWRANRLTTKLDWAGKGPPLFSIGRKQDRERCKPGDEASMTVEVVQRANGERGTRTIAFEVHRKGDTDGDDRG